MRKNRNKDCLGIIKCPEKSMLVMKWICVFSCMLLFQISAVAYSQKKVTLDVNEMELVDVIQELRKQTGYKFFFNHNELKKAGSVSGKFVEKDLNFVLDEMLGKVNLTYRLERGIIVIVPKKESVVEEEEKKLEITGKVTDEKGEPLAGVTVVLKGFMFGTSTDVNGKYKLAIPNAPAKFSLTFSFIGMKSVEKAYAGKNVINVVMKEEAATLDDVVVTGIYTRKKESFTGSSQTYTADDLKMVGNQNILQSLKTLDPAFNILESKEYGSDPNRLPDIEIRGKSSIVGLKEEYGQDPNQPLFILDGFETTLQVIMDLNMDRVASVTILKDAASTAIYGSKAANGVVVVETKAPARGSLRLSYNGSMDISFADLTDYNLMNAEEKLEFERLSGAFTSESAAEQEQLTGRYNRLLRDVKRGVDSYWLSEPLRLGLTHRHNLYVEGGDNQMRYGLGVNYSGIQGVMKNSIRDIMGLSLDLIYRKKGFNFMNKLSVDWNKNDNPVVSFYEYASANPYYEKKSGSTDRWLEDWQPENIAGLVYRQIRVANPSYDDAQNSYNQGNSFSVRDNFSVEIRPVDALSIRGRVGITKGITETETFTSPNDTQFDKVEPLRKGSYFNSTSNSLNWSADFTVTYGELLGDKHMINVAAGINISENDMTTKSFSAQGFPEGNFTKPSFANKYPEGGKPGYMENKNRNANFYLNGGYVFDERYLMDINLRSDGTSVFGSNKRFSTTWSVGLAWNVHKEKFLRDKSSIINVLKLRGSIGNPGNQNFGSYSAITTYYFNNWMLNNFGTGVLVSTFGDPDLAWQRTLDKNIGLDLSMFSNRFHVTFDFYHKRTDPLIADIGVPVSMGVSTRRTNIGVQVDKGFNGSVRYAILYKPQESINYTMSVNFRYGTAHYEDIGRSLNAYNQENISKNLTRYYDGGSPTALWAVRSRGIDPATGQEIFVRKDGTLTYTFDYDDEVEVGDSRPTLEGVWGNTLYYKGWSASLQVRYSFGADVFNSTLFNKVENISSGSITTNQDKRALYDRWKKPGDKAKFKSISLTETTPMSSRFVMKENYLAIESVRVGYQFNSQWLKKNLKISSLNINMYMNSIARFSTLEDERGLYYPFARSISFSLGAIL